MVRKKNFRPAEILWKFSLHYFQYISMFLLEYIKKIIISCEQHYLSHYVVRNSINYPYY
jgi:hypothetical protein